MNKRMKIKTAAVIVCAVVHAAAAAIVDVNNSEVCTIIAEGNTATPLLLKNKHIRVGLYYGELSACTYGKRAHRKALPRWCSRNHEDADNAMVLSCLLFLPPFPPRFERRCFTRRSNRQLL